MPQCITSHEHTGLQAESALRVQLNQEQAEALVKQHRPAVIARGSASYVFQAAGEKTVATADNRQRGEILRKAGYSNAVTAAVENGPVSASTMAAQDAGNATRATVAQPSAAQPPATVSAAPIVQQAVDGNDQRAAVLDYVITIEPPMSGVAGPGQQGQEQNQSQGQTGGAAIGTPATMPEARQNAK